MKKREAEALGALAGIGSILVVAGVIDYVKVVREERRKRKLIKVWETNTLGAIKAARERCRRIANDPTATSKDLLQAWVEEMQFIKLIENQPMY
jgi:hypothetical protein